MNSAITGISEFPLLTYSIASGTRKFIATVVNFGHRMLSWARSSQFSSQT